MSKFNTIAKLRDDFDDRLYHVDQFKTTKGILYDFGKYIKENKAVLVALLTATSINAISQLSAIKEMDFGALLNSQAQYETVVQTATNSIPTELVAKSDYSGIDMKSSLETFKESTQLANAITNSKYIGQDIQDLSLDGILHVKSMPEKTPVVFKNPFWENNVIEIENVSMGSRFYHTPSKMDANLHTASVLSSNTAQRLILDFNEIDGLTKFIDAKPEDANLILKYVVYHEAAHGSFHQNHEFNATQQANSREVDVESHADLASVMMISSETQNLSDFNKLVDYAIKFRMKRMEHDISHNSTYALAELKQLINKNPELLTMKKSDISTFAATISEQVKNHKFSDQELANLEKYGVSFSEAKILNDLKTNANETLYRTWGQSFPAGFDIHNIQKMPDGIKERKFNGYASRFASEFQQSAKYDVITSMMNAHNKWDLDKTAKDLNDYVKNNSILDRGIQSSIDYKVQIDKLTNLESQQATIKIGQKNILERTSQNNFKI